MRPLIRRPLGALSALLLFTAAACAAAGPNGAGQLSPVTPLNVGLSPGAPAAAAGTNSPLVAYLENAMARPVQMRIEPSLAAMAADLRAAHIDVAFVSDIAYLSVARLAPIRVIGQAATASPSRPVIVCSSTLGVKPVKDGGDWSALRGRSMLFGPQGSLGANVWPRYFMTRNGLDPIGDVTAAIVVSNERQAILEVYNGIADCAATSTDSRSSVADVAPDVASRVQVAFAAPDPVPPAPHVARRGLDTQVAKRFEHALAAIKVDPAAAAIAASVAAGPGAQPAADRDYVLLRTAVETVDPSLITRTS